jgi:hypothetical protein
MATRPMTVPPLLYEHPEGGFRLLFPGRWRMERPAQSELPPDRQFDRIEFYGRLMDWHLRWTDEVRTLYHVVCHGSGLLRPLLGRLRR